MQNGESAVNACHRSKAGCKKLLRLALSDQSLTVAASEFFDATSRVDKLLFAREKRMASGADTDSNVATGGAGMIHGAARANHVGLEIFRMDVRFHLGKGAKNLRALTEIGK